MVNSKNKDGASRSVRQAKWKRISEKYVIYDSGEIVNKKTNRTLKQRLTPQGYLGLNLSFDGLPKTCTTHRLVAEHFLEDFDPLKQVDHINGNRTDNRASNLRMLTAQQNARAYRKPIANASSKYRGVDWVNRGKRWRSKIVSDGNAIYLGCFKNEIDAAKAFDKKAIELGFENEALNFPKL